MIPHFHSFYFQGPNLTSQHWRSLSFIRFFEESRELPSSEIHPWAFSKWFFGSLRIYHGVSVFSYLLSSFEVTVFAFVSVHVKSLSRPRISLFLFCICNCDMFIQWHVSLFVTSRRFVYRSSPPEIPLFLFGGSILKFDASSWTVFFNLGFLLSWTAFLMMLYRISDNPIACLRICDRLWLTSRESHSPPLFPHVAEPFAETRIHVFLIFCQCNSKKKKLSSLTSSHCSFSRVFLPHQLWSTARFSDSAILSHKYLVFE